MLRKFSVKFIEIVITVLKKIVEKFLWIFVENVEEISGKIYEDLSQILRICWYSVGN